MQGWVLEVVRPWIRSGRTWVVVVGASLLSTGCVAAIAGGAVVTAVGAAVITQGCYDPVRVELLDAVTALPVCDARLVARNADGKETKFSSCFYAELPVGKWVLEAQRAGYEPAQVPLLVSKPNGCEPARQSVALYLWPVGQRPQPTVPGQVAPAPLPPVVAPSSVAPSSEVPPVAPSPAGGTGGAPAVETAGSSSVGFPTESSGSGGTSTAPTPAPSAAGGAVR